MGCKLEYQVTKESAEKIAGGLIIEDYYGVIFCAKKCYGGIGKKVIDVLCDDKCKHYVVDGNDLALGNNC